MKGMRSRILLVLLAGAALGALALPGLRARLWPTPPAPPAVSVPEPDPPPTRTSAVRLRPGDTLVGALGREGVGPRLGHEIARALRQSGADLRKLRPRDRLEVTWTLAGEPVELRYAPGPWLAFVAYAAGTRWEVRRAETRPDVRVEAVTGEVHRSLFEAVEEAGESAQLVLAMVEIFSSDFDFTADTREGDRFRLLVEKRYAGAAFVDYGRVLVAQYVSDGRVLTGVGFERGARFGHYDPEGRSLKKSFLKSPLEFTRITSGFTYRRPHPILGGVRPHLAIDYAAPAGTPVRAVADGVVARAGWAGGSGIQIQLRHRASYETQYNHLSRLAAGVRPGARVRQRQVIGYVGSTGLSTGPHLDYRVAYRGRFVNPLAEKFIPGEPVPSSERAEFLRLARELVRRLEDAAPL
ncbi:MAG: hypothetical protein A2W08_18300 [Candidatus Rokubacteria bacterium RBG_16_73_20]|nr:MAG: hypothetical protein A2W08_18300 [Candidatus Rokubacteria bacterium RBG_16_73_20]HBH00519.1 hypothetical protein [Candidatus Rokubacteria bacterium]